MIEFKIPMVPSPKQSFRMGKRGGYQPARIAQNTNNLCHLMLQHRPDPPLSGALELDVVVQYRYRKSEPKKNRNAPIIKPNGADHDNLQKQLCDAMQTIGFFENGDEQIAVSHFRKQWGRRDCTRVRISRHAKPFGEEDMV